MDDKQKTLEILRNMKDKKAIEYNKRAGLCFLFAYEESLFFRTHYGVFPLNKYQNLHSVFEQTAQAVLGYEVEQHAFWLLPLGEDGNYTLPTYAFEENEEGEIVVTPMYDPVTGQSCPEIYVNEPERLTSARLKLLDDMIAYLEKGIEMRPYTRKQYLEDLEKLRGEYPGHLLSQKHSEKAQELHQKYYGQLVTESTKNIVKSTFGMECLLASTDPHLNDIPLKRWDDLYLPRIPSMKPLGDYLTLAGKVCIAKEAARQLIEEARGAN